MITEQKLITTEQLLFDYDYYLHKIGFEYLLLFF